MRAVLAPILIDIDYIPELNHPLVQGFIDPEVEVTDMHLEAIAEAVMLGEDQIREAQ